MKQTNRKRPNKYSKFQSSNEKNTKKDRYDSKEVTKDNAKYNDPSWYIREGQMAKDVASLSFNNALGVNFNMNQELSGNVTPANAYVGTLPGIFVINTAPSFGATYDGRSPINVAAKNIIGFIRSYNSGAKNYDSPDLMLMLGSMDGIYALIAHFMRAYGTARVFSHTNRYIGDALLYAMGFNADEVRQNLANFRAYINMLITKASAICTPNIMTIYARHFWMYSGVYKDEDIDKAQMYLYRPNIIWSYEEGDGAGYLKANAVGANATSNGIVPTLWSLTEWETFADSCMNKLLNSQDIAVMSGDILKAYGEGNLWKLSLINEDYAVIPVYSNEVLDQIHNTTFVGNAVTGGITSSSSAVNFDLSGLDVTQKASGSGDPWLYFQPQFIKQTATSWTRMCDLNEGEPTPERVIVATRNMVMCSMLSVASTYVSTLATSGSDLCLSGSVVQYGTNGLLTSELLFGSDVTTATGSYSALRKFKRSPIMYRMSSAQGGGTLQAIEGEIDNYTLVSFDDLRRMHESALLAMLGVPFYGLQTR